MRLRVLTLLLVAAGGALAAEPHPIFRSPLTGKVVKTVGRAGIDIYAPVGEAVHAAGDGAVLYASDELATFGKMVVIRHADGYFSIYAHLSELAVKRGDTVRRGQILGKSGQSGEVSHPLLHFELLKSGAALDPVGYLGPR